MGEGTNIALIGGIILAFLYMSLGRKTLSPKFIIVFYIIIIFGVAYSIILNNHEDLSIFRGYRELFLPAVLYTVGYLSIKSKTFSLMNISLYKNVFLVISISLFIYAFLNLFFHLNYYGDVKLYNRSIYDIWNGGLLEATAQGSKLTLISVMIVPLLLSWNSFKPPLRLVLLFCIVISVISTLIMANRSLFAIIGVTFFAGLLLYFKLNSNKLGKNIKAIGIVTIVALSIPLLYYFDIMGVRSFYESSSFNQRLDEVNGGTFQNNPRFEAWSKTLLGILQFPMGGSQVSIGLTYAHNLWLDVAYKTGIIPFVLLLLLTVLYIFYLMKLLYNNYISIGMKVFIFSTSVGLILNLMIEPILEGHYYMFMIFIFQLGLMHGFVEGIKSVKSQI